MPKPLTRSFVLNPEHDTFLTECADAVDRSVSFVLRRAIERAMRDPLFLREITTSSVITPTASVNRVPAEVA